MQIGNNRTCIYFGCIQSAVVVMLIFTSRVHAMSTLENCCRLYEALQSASMGGVAAVGDSGGIGFVQFKAYVDNLKKVAHEEDHWPDWRNSFGLGKHTSHSLRLCVSHAPLATAPLRTQLHFCRFFLLMCRGIPQINMNSCW